MVSDVFFEFSFDKMFEKKNLKLIFFVLYVIVNIRVGKVMLILLWCNFELVVIVLFYFFKRYVYENKFFL